jgi:hypothetical protein
MAFPENPSQQSARVAAPGTTQGQGRANTRGGARENLAATVVSELSDFTKQYFALSRTDKIGKAVLGLREKLAKDLALGRRPLEREDSKRKFLAELLPTMNAVDVLKVGKEVDVRDTKSVRGRAGAIHQVTAGGEIAGTAGGVGEFEGHAQNLMRQNSYLKAKLASGTEAWDALEPNILDNSEGAEKNKLNFMAAYGGSGSDLMGFMDRTNAASAILGLGETPPQVFGDIKANTDLRAGKWKRLVAEHYQNIRSKYIFETANNDTNAISIGMIEMLGKGALNDITKALKGDFLTDIGMTFGDALEYVQKQEQTTLTWAKEVFKKGDRAATLERLDQINKLTDATVAFQDNEYMEKLKSVNRPLWDLAQKGRTGVTKAVTEVAAIAATFGARVPQERFLRMLVDPSAKRQAVSAIHMLSSPAPELTEGQIKEYMKDVENSPILTLNPRLVTNYATAMRGLIKRVKNPKIADELEENLKRWLNNNKKQWNVWQKVGVN